MAITYGMLFQGAQNVHEGLGEITQQVRTILLNLDQETATSLASWRGATRDVYTQAKQRWDEAANQMPTHLTQASTALGDMINITNNAESYGSGLFG